MYYIALIFLGVSIVVFVLLPFYIRLKHQEHYVPLKIFIKGVMTFIALMFCLSGLMKIYSSTRDIFNLTTEKGFHTDILIAAALFICMIADMFLVRKFMTGVVFFLLGHICYIIYFIRIGGFNPVSIPVFAVILTCMALYFNRYKERMGKAMPAFYVYGTVITCTVSLGVMLPFSLGPYGVIPAISSVLLIISDIMLAMNKFTRKVPLSDLLYLSYYFTGQFFLAMSVFIPAYLNV